MSDRIHKCTRTSQPPQSHGEPSGSSSECSFTGVWHVTYNAENRPICFSNETTVVSMAYDYMGRRFKYKKTVNSALTRHERYLYRGYLQIATLDMLNASSVKHTIAWDPSEPTATRPLSLQIGTAAYFYSFDQVKNVTELFDGVGAIAATYDYSPFGQVTSFQMMQSGNNALTQSSNPLTFSSEVSDTTLGLQYYNYRHLNVIYGRWVNRDPIRERGGMNVYGFINNSVIDKTDRVGLVGNDPPQSVSKYCCGNPPIVYDPKEYCCCKNGKVVGSDFSSECRLLPNKETPSGIQIMRYNLPPISGDPQNHVYLVWSGYGFDGSAESNRGYNGRIVESPAKSNPLADGPPEDVKLNRCKYDLRKTHKCLTETAKSMNGKKGGLCYVFVQNLLASCLKTSEKECTSM